MLSLHSPYTSRPSLRVGLLRSTYRTARRLGMSAKASFGVALLALDCGL
jgi:hypothetical protein